MKHEKQLDYDSWDTDTDATSVSPDASEAQVAARAQTTKTGQVLQECVNTVCTRKCPEELRVSQEVGVHAFNPSTQRQAGEAL